MAGDLLEELEVLVAEVARCYERGRRYRDIAELCDERYLGRALDIGAALRRHRRAGDLDESMAATFVADLRGLLAECSATVAGVRAGEPYRHAVAAWSACRWADVAVTAPAIFTAVEPWPVRPRLYQGFSLRRRRGGTDPFVPPAECAAAIAQLREDGITAPLTPPALGGDETIRPIVLADDPADTDSPVVIVLDAAAVGLPLCQVAPAGDVLLYAPAVHVPFRVRLAPRVDDEWWAVRPEAYAEYVQKLATELAAHGLDADAA